MRRPIVSRIAAFAVAVAVALLVSGTGLHGQDGFRFRTSVELVNVTATVTDRSGRFVPGLTRDDFTVYKDDHPVDVTHFNAERVPVSLGILVDTSGSMAGDRITSARAAIERFLDRLLNPDDEVFLYSFATTVDHVQEWTRNREAVSANLRRVRASGGTAMYDAVMEAVPSAQAGRNGKKAVVLISDGNDTSSRAGLRDVRQVVRETEVLVYAVGLDGEAAEPTTFRPRMPTFPPAPIPFPIPGRGRPRLPWPVRPQVPPRTNRIGGIDRVNVAALRDITDDSGGRTEIVRDAGDLGPATASIADELSRRSYLGYASPSALDGRWHTIRVEVHDTSLRVRARRGYIATP